MNIFKFLNFVSNVVNIPRNRELKQTPFRSFFPKYEGDFEVKTFFILGI